MQQQQSVEIKLLSGLAKEVIFLAVLNMMRLQSYPECFSALPQLHEAEIREALSLIKSDAGLLRQLLAVIDITTLKCTDNDLRVTALCAKALQLAEHGLPPVAAVCIYPAFVPVARKAIGSGGVRLASVAGGFPSSQIPLHLKLNEIKYVLEEGADEIDIVMPVGKFLQGAFTEVFDELAAIREACGKKTLKVILETGVLHGKEEIQKASALAIAAGADFIKTSTGKEGKGASLESVFIMADTISHFNASSTQAVGIKPSGGISDVDAALQMIGLVRNILGANRITPNYFRIGASSLANRIIARLKPELNPYFE